MDFGVINEKVRQLDKSRGGYLAVITKTCNIIDNLTDIDNIALLKQLELRLLENLDKYRACCEKYYLFLDDDCTKCVDVATSYHAQRQRVNFYVNKVNVLISDAVKSEISKLELEIQRSECELQQAIMNSNTDRANETVGSNVSISEPMMRFSLQENSTNDVYTVIPPPRMFADIATPLVVGNCLPKTSTPFVTMPSVNITLPATLEKHPPKESREASATQGAQLIRDQSDDYQVPCNLAQNSILQGQRLFNIDTVIPKPTIPQGTQTEVNQNDDSSHQQRFNSEIIQTPPQLRGTQTKMSTQEPHCIHQHQGESSGKTITPTYHPDIGETAAPPPPAFADQSASIVEAFVATIDKMSATRDLPAVKVLKFDGSPEKYPAFLLRFQQLIESKPLDDTVKMTRLLQFLEGPALAAVQRYETIPGGLTKALDILKDRFGRPYHVVKACVDSMTKGPTINPSDHQALQRFADEVQANYDTLAAMGYLSEINTDNLGKILSRLPKGIQGKFVERLNSLERQGQVMPSFEDVVDFLRDRAHVVNHPFLSQSSQPISKLQEKQPIKSTYVKSSTFVTTTTTPTKEPCLVCSKDHRLYQCDAFKAKSSRERTELVKNNRLCFNCLSSNHHVKQCKSTGRCRVSGCGKPHHTLLHYERKEEKSDSSNTQTTDVTKGNFSVSTKIASHEVLLQVVPLRVTSMSGNTLTTYGLLDSGSDITMIDPSLALLLGMKGNPSKLCLSTVSDPAVEESGLKVKFKISSVDAVNDKCISVDSAWAIRDLSIPLKHAEVLKDVTNWPHLQNVPFPEVERKKVSVLIGTNIHEAFVPLEVRRGSHDEPFAIRSCIGWSVLGGARKGIFGNAAHTNHVNSRDTELNDQLQRFWKLESYGAEMTTRPMSVEDKKAMTIIDETLCRDGNHYKMGLLWKEPTPRLPHNRPLAEARIIHLKSRFKRDPQLFTKYKTVMDEYIKKGYAVKLSREEAAKVSGKTWYLPHHPVKNPNKPEKIRVVFDAAAKYRETSLNDNLLQGPCLINDLTGVLLRFREDLFAFTADVEAMFYQVQVIEEDTDALRFLWWTSDDLDSPPEEFKMCVHIFGAKSSPCCANKALRQTAQDNDDVYDQEVIQTVNRNFYVDDVLKSAPSKERAIHLATDLIKLLAEGGFHLSKFSSNNREVLTSIDVEDRANPKLDMDLDRLPVGRALGVYWDPETDVFGFKFTPPCKPNTKRGILSVASSLFDPLGFLAPLTLPVKIILQDLWRAGVSWDEEVPEPFLSLWKEWLRGIPYVVNVHIPRCFKSQSLSSPSCVQLHVFSDASRRGLAAVAYLRMLNQLGQIYCSFVMGKVKNAPAREWTVPRLELQAAVLATRLSRTLLKELDMPIDSTTHWTDSLTTLQYIRNHTRRFPVLESNRITEIHESTSVEQWRHVPGILNPADEGSRGVTIDYFEDGCRWWSGPDFLWQTEDKWPCEGPQPQESAEVADRAACNSNLTSTLATESRVYQLLNRYSSWSRLLRVMAWLLRFVKALKREKPCLTSFLKLTELQDASLEIVRLVQVESFPDEYNALKSQRPVKKTSPLSPLNPIMVDGIMRVGGRIRNAPLPPDVKHPMILPRDHYISKLIVTYYHKALCHAGREHVLSTIRGRYWIVNGRSLVRRLLHKCIECRKRHAQPMEQAMGDLPKERLTPFEAPFTFTGVDFFGPFHVKRGRATVKIYGCIFVCFTTRAIHIEDASALSTDAFIQALRRFIALRGCPREIWSDNGTNFTGASKELRESVKEFNDDLIRRELHSKGSEWHSCPTPKWKFQPPTASHMSGVWERLIRSVRKTMSPLIGNVSAPLTLETLRTVFCEAVSILNSRPLCPSSDDPNDLEPLTPNHFLLLRQNVTTPPGIFTKDDIYARKQWRHAQFIANHFWSRWIKEYIPLLQQRTKWTTVRRNLKVNDLVLITDANEARSKWLLGRVIRVFPGKDDRVRSAELKTKGSNLIRPIHKLCLLEESS